MGGVIVVMTTGLGQIPELSFESKVGRGGGAEGQDLADIRCAFQSCIQWWLNGRLQRIPAQKVVILETLLVRVEEGGGRFFPLLPFFFFLSAKQTANGCPCVQSIHVLSAGIHSNPIPSLAQ